jgi:hypothetical protein
MKFSILCETFLRLSNCAGVNDPEPALNSVRLENSNGKVFAVASNRKIMAVEYLGETDEPDGAINIAVHQDIIDACEYSENQQRFITVNSWQEFGVATMNIGVFSPYALPFTNPDTFEPFRNWRGQFPTWLPKVDKGFVWFETEQLNKLGLSSPSGMIALPEVLDNTRRVIVRDIHDPNWCGVFIPYHPNNPNVKPATLPEWLK